jgi:1-acyl-sn-glycerol-3-phosphate acyltransferase
MDPCNPYNRDPEFIEKLALPVLRFALKYYFRTEAEGLENIPREGPFLVVSNHNGGPILPDTWMMLAIYWNEFGTEKPGYALVHDIVFRVPVVRTFLGKVGAMRASTENAKRILDMGGPLVVYPGGTEDCFKSFWKRHKICFENRTGFIKLALDKKVPILPVVSSGGHEVYFTLFSSRRLARWTGLSRWARIKSCPVNLGLPWGIWMTGFLPYLPLPSKMRFKVGSLIHLDPPSASAANNGFVDACYRQVVDVMQGMLDELAEERRWPVLG